MIHEFKAGDVIRMMKSCSGCDKGKKYTLILYEGTLTADNCRGDGGCQCEGYWELVKSNVINMSVVEKFKLALLPEPEKTFRKLGIIDGDNVLTADGMTLMMNFLVNKFKKEFNDEVVSKLIDEEK